MIPISGSTRIKGTQLTLKLGNPGTDYKCDTTKAELNFREASDDTLTFCDAGGEGAVESYFSITGIQSTDTESFWSYLWDHAGDVVGFAYAPHGNATPSTSQPHFTGNLKLGIRPKLGGEAGRNNTFTFDTEWIVEGAITKVTSGA